MVHRKKLILASLMVLVVLAVIPLMSAKVETQVNNNGFQIFHPDFDFVPQDTDFKLHIHASNVSTGLPLVNTDADCYLHLYSPDGNHSFEGIMGLDGNGQDWDLFIGGGNFSDLGIHSFYIWCNNSAFGGEAKGTFEVNRNGIEPTQARATLNAAMMFLLVLLFILCVWLMLRMDNYKRDVEGEILGINQLKYIRFPLFTIAYGILMGIFYIASNIGFGYLGDELFAQIFFTLFAVMMKLYIVILLVVTAWFFFQIVQDKKIKGMIERGVDFEGASKQSVI